MLFLHAACVLAVHKRLTLVHISIFAFFSQFLQPLLVRAAGTSWMPRPSPRARKAMRVRSSLPCSCNLALDFRPPHPMWIQLQHATKPGPTICHGKAHCASILRATTAVRAKFCVCDCAVVREWCVRGTKTAMRVVELTMQKRKVMRNLRHRMAATSRLRRSPHQRCVDLHFACSSSSSCPQL